MSNQPRLLLISFSVITLLVACAPGVTATALPFTAPTFTSVPPSPTASPPLAPQVELTSRDTLEANRVPDYDITVSLPVLSGSDDPRVTAFNDLAAQLVQAQVFEFKANLASVPPSADGTPSELNIQHILLSPSLEIISIRFDIAIYMQGAAHPISLARSINFDLERGQEISLDSLFLPDSGYLLTLGNFCATELQRRNIGFDALLSQGAAPLPENYRNWALTEQGLLITFEQYQVAAGAAGPQTVLIPFVELAPLVNPQGVLAGFLR